MDRSLKYILLVIVMMLPLGLKAQSDTAAPSVNVQEVIFGHIQDSYEWHITNFGTHKVSVYLPVIVYSKTSGWHCFCSRHLEDAEYEGFHIAASGKAAGKVVETVNGTEVKPFDISITKDVLSLFIGSGILLLLVLLTARWYRKHDSLEEAPTGLAALMEPLIMMVHNDVARDSIGEEEFRKYSPYLCTAFLWILVNNFLGIIPFFPGGANLTGNITITFVLAICTMFAVNAFGNKNYFKDIFWPDVPWWLKVPIPLMPVIELFGVFTKPFSLMVRLFANMMAGHILLLSMCCVLFIVVKYGAVLTGSMTVVAVVFGIFMDMLELLVSFIQAYVFTVLSAIFIGLAHQKE